MKLIYLADIRLPTERAHGIQIMKMCESFARAGVRVVLTIPTRQNPIAQDPFSYYGIDAIFTIREIRTPNLLRWGKTGFILHRALFSLAAFAILLFQKEKGDVVYSRDEITLALPALFGWHNVFWEAHGPKDNAPALFVARHASGLVCITQSLAEFFEGKGVARSRMIVAHDAVDIGRFRLAASQEECRERTGLSGHGKIALYAGHLYERKGASTFADAASFLPGVSFVIVGGNDHEIASFRTRYEKQRNVLVVGRRPHQDIPLYLKAADAVVLPNSAKDLSSERYTSPMKLFEYMASGTPIVASDVAASREILGGRNALLVPPDDARALADGIKRVLNDKSQAQERAARAFDEVAGVYTWDKRAQKIGAFIKLGSFDKSKE